MTNRRVHGMSFIESNGHIVCRVKGYPLLIQMDPEQDFCSCVTNRKLEKDCMHLQAYREYSWGSEDAPGTQQRLF